MIPLSIVITTYNRELELRRCIDSIMSQNYESFEVIVVDDCSKELYKEKILKEYPFVKYIYQKENMGPGTARNKGIQEAKNNYVVIMDDDDVFLPAAFHEVVEFITQGIIGDYPVISFLMDNAIVDSKESFYVYSFDDLISGMLVGDTCQIINKELWMKSNYVFPNSKIGAESLLWYRVALDYGYPIINKVIVKVMHDADGRLTDFSRQIKQANLFAQYQIDIINLFGDAIKKNNRLDFLASKYKGAIIYSLLYGDKLQAKSLLSEFKQYSKKHYVIFSSLLFLNPKVLAWIFLKYRVLMSK